MLKFPLQVLVKLDVQKSMNTIDIFSQKDNLISKWKAGSAKVNVYNNRDSMAKEASIEVRKKIQYMVQQESHIRMVFAAAPSQTEFLSYLTAAPDIPWNCVTAFHMDDYIKLPRDAPQRFSNWLDQHLFSKVPFKKINKIASTGTPEDICARYAAQLSEDPINIVCLGIGVNGHLAFNDPPVADFEDKLDVKLVKLDDVCRQQQVDDGCFKSFSEVPEYAVTLTIPQLMSAKSLICVVPGSHKKNAVKTALFGPISVSCPASILQTHKNAKIFLDQEAGSND